MWRQCDQIGRFLKVLAGMCYYKSNPNIYDFLCYFKEHNFLIINCIVQIVGQHFEKISRSFIPTFGQTVLILKPSLPESAQRFRTGQSICQFQFRSIRVFQLNRTNEILKLLYQNKKRFFKNLAPTLIISKIYCSLSLFSTQSLLQTSLLFLSLPVILFTWYGSHYHITICCSLSAFFLSLPVIPKPPSTYLPKCLSLNCLCSLHPSANVSLSVQCRYF